MSLNHTLSEVLNNITSDRITERRKAAEILRGLLDGDGAPECINANHQNSEFPSWNDVLKMVHEMMLKEAEKFKDTESIRGNLQDKVISNCTYLMQKTITHSIKGKCYGKWDIFYCNFSKIFELAKFRKFYGELYLAILTKNILMEEYYLEHISPHSWSDLLKLAIDLWSLPDVGKNEVARLIAVIITKASKCCHFIIPVRNNLAKFATMIVSTNVTNKLLLQESFLEIVISIMENVATESRLAICNFSETVVPVIMTYYSKTTDTNKDKKVLVFRALDLAINIHHPNGRLDMEKGSFAGNWPVWKSHLRQIRDLIVAESIFLNKNIEGAERLGMRRDRDVPDEFLTLAVDGCHIIFHSNESERPEKRIRLEQNVSLESFLDLIRHSLSLHYPWLRILQKYMSKYGETLKVHEITQLRNSFSPIILSEDLGGEWIFFINISETFIDMPKSAGQQYMGKIWGACLRNLNTDTHNDSTIQTSHSVIQKIIKRDRIDSSSLNLLLKLYKDATIKLTDPSVETLNVIFERSGHELNDPELRQNMVKWILNSSIKTFKVEQIAQLLLRLITVESITFLNTEIRQEKNIMKNMAFTMKENLLLTDFENRLLIDNIEQKVHTVKSTNFRSSHLTVHQSSNDSLISDINKKLQEIQNSLENPRNLNLSSVTFVSVILHYLNLMIEKKILTFENLSRCAIWHKAIQFVNLLTEGNIVNYFLSGSGSRNGGNCDFLLTLKCLFKMKTFNDNVRESLTKSIHTDLFTIISNRIMTKENEDDPAFESDPRGCIRPFCLDFLAHFCFFKSTYRDELLSFILDKQLHDLTDAKQTSTFLTILHDIAYDADDIPLDKILNLLLYICTKLYRSNDVTYQLLTILRRIIGNIFSNGEARDENNTIVMLSGFIKKSEKEYYEPKMIAMIFDCIQKIHSIKSAAVVPLRAKVFESLSSPLHSVRICAIYLSVKLLRGCRENEYKEILDELLLLYIVDSNLASDVSQDEGANRTFTILQFLSCLVVDNPTWGIKSLATIVELSKSKQIDHALIIKVFSKIADYYKSPEIIKPTAHEIMSKNFEYVLYHWMDKDFPILDFPCNLMKVSAIDKFMVINREVIVSAGFLKISREESRKTVFTRISTHLKISEKELFSDCIHSIVTTLLPYYLHSEHDLSSDVWHPDSRYIIRAKESFNKFIKIYQENELKSTYGKNIEKIIKYSVKHVFDRDHFENNFGETMALTRMNGTFYTTAIFDLILSYFNDIFSKDILKHLCQNEPSVIQGILLDLWKAIDDQMFLQMKILSFHHFYIFFEALPLDTKLDHFICRFGCQSLLHIIEKYSTMENYKFLSLIACEGLRKVLLKLIPKSIYAVRDFLKNIVSSLVRIAKDKTIDLKLPKKVLTILKWLLVDMSSHIREEISLLDPLPQDDLFMNLKQSMCDLGTRDTVSSYVPIFVNGGETNRYEALLRLETLLSNSKDELRLLFADLKKIRGFSEESDSSLLHKLVRILVGIVETTDSGDKSCQAAGRCLGIIGPSDLRTFTPRSFSDNNQIRELNPLQYLASKTFEVCEFFLNDMCPNVVAAAASALSTLLSFKEGRQLITEDSQLLIPYIPMRKNVPCAQLSISVEFQERMGNPQLWLANESYKVWLENLVTAILSSFIHDHCFVGELLQLCKLKITAAEKLFPPLLGALFSCAKQDNANMIANGIRGFFDNHYDQTSSSIDRMHSIEPQAVKTMINAVEFLRLQKCHYGKSTGKGFQEEAYNPLNLDYLKVAKAAAQTLQHLFAIIYADLWWWGKRESDIDPDDMEEMQKIRRKSFTAFGDVDAVYGCGSAHLSDVTERKDHFIRLGLYSDAISMHDIAISHCKESDPEFLLELRVEMARTLQMSGHYHMAALYMKDISDQTLDDLKYETMWRLGDWDLHFNPSLNIMPDNPEFNQKKSKMIMAACQYQCLKDSLNKDVVKDDHLIDYLLESGRRCVKFILDETGSESCRSIYQVAAKFQYFSEIEYFRKIKMENSEQSYFNLLQEWRTSNILPFNDIKDFEPILAQRSVILENMLPSNANQNLRKNVVDLQLEYAELALDNDLTQLCSRLITTAARISGDTFANKVKLMEGRAAWKNGHVEVALHLVKNLISQGNIDDRLLYANALRLYGAWMIETRSESAQQILYKYMDKTLMELKSVENSNIKLQVYLDIARFMDKEYRQVEAYIKSSAFESKVKCMEEMKHTANNLKQVSQSLTNDEKRVMLVNDRKSDLDEREINNTYNEKQKYLKLAIKYFLLALASGELDDLCMFRVISLWLDNPDLELDDSGGQMLDKLFSSVPSRKFLQVLPQVAPRMNTQRSSFTAKLDKIISRCALEHPHHTLPILLALSNSHKDNVILNESVRKITSSSRSNASQVSNEEPRVIAARNLLNKLSRDNAQLAVIIQQMEAMCDAMISLANYKVKEKRPGRESIPKSESLRKLKGLNAVLVPTVTLPVDSSLNYADIPSIISFSDTFDMVGGVNRPKKLMCNGSDGVNRPMLLKGEDDLRQDAVMQQVFSIANQLLSADRDTGKRRLIVRTYKVVPLSRRSGVLEWCIGTEPFGVYLIGVDGASGAHAKYRPQDISSRKAREKLHSIVKLSNEMKLEAFQNILSQFKPVFHHFFFDNFLAPAVWYERRLAYTHSVATSSMIGYILGLGDRHVHNILIDKSTADVIHIDFGIAFDQGKVLPTPEGVPFRLSQDIIAGFGVSGVEGVFRRSCEKTMRVLRVNRETLLTILSVLLFDPLYMWSITPAQAYKKQGMEFNLSLASNGVASVSSEAERALLALRGKLEGSAEGWIGSGAGVAIRGQVATLIQQATDPANLSRLFQGWQAYL